MSDKETFGYDPLAWLREETEGTAPAAAAEQNEAASGGAADEVTETPAPEGAPVALSLPEVLHVSEVEDLKARLAGTLDGSAVAIDGSGVERVDGASLQLLCAFARHARERGIELTWQGVSEALSGSAATLGLEGELFR